MILYHLIAHLAAVAVVPLVLVAALFSTKYRTGLTQRFGRLPAIAVPKEETRRVWLHCASVGEVNTAAPLIEKMLADGRFDLVLSTMTPGGNAVAAGKFGARCPVVFWPVELFWAVGAAFRAIWPDALVVMETELWPAVLAAADSRGVPVALVNARISDKTHARYRLLRPFLTPLLRRIEMIAAQSESHAERFASLGVDANRVRVVGNLKFDMALDRDALRVQSAYLERVWQRNAPLLVAASTHDGEERAVLDAWLAARERMPDLRIAIAPRHIERAGAVERLLESANVPVIRRTALPGGAADDRPALLLDTLGELAALIARADACFVGGSLVPVGGHNVLEPAALGVPALFGPHMANFRDARDALLAARAAVQVRDAKSLATALITLFGDEKTRRTMGENGAAAVEKSRGATVRAFDLVRDLAGLG